MQQPCHPSSPVTSRFGVTWVRNSARGVLGGGGRKPASKRPGRAEPGKLERLFWQALAGECFSRVPRIRQ